MKIRRRGGSGAQGLSSARRPMNLKHHLTPALSPTSWRRGSGNRGLHWGEGFNERLIFGEFSRRTGEAR
jgi:hypothetical protein